MPNRRSHPADHVHFAPGLAGTLGWMGYWAASRSENARRSLRHRWQTRLRPTLIEQATTIKGQAATLLRRSDNTQAPRPYESLADAVQQRGWVDAHG